MFSQTLLAQLPRPVSCRLLASLRTKYIESEMTLTDSERRCVETHLSVCAECLEEDSAIRAVGTLLRRRGAAALPAHEPASDLWARIESEIIAQELPANRKPAFRPMYVFAPALAAIVVVAILMPKPTSNLAPLASNAMAPAMKSANAPSVAAGGNTIPATVAKSLQSMPSPKSVRKSEMVPPTEVAVRQESARRQSPPMIAMESERSVTLPVRRSRSQESIADLSSSTRISAVSRPAVAAKSKNEASEPVMITVVDAISPSESEARLPIAETSVAGTMHPSEIQPRAVVPAVPVKVAMANRLSTGTITIVSSSPGSGIPSETATQSSVAEALIRQRQKRGLFGGYGGGASAMLPATINTTNIDESSTPW